MQRARESQAALRLVVESAVEDGRSVLQATSGSMESRRLTLLDTVPALVGYYSEGTSALAADFYEEERAAARVASRYTAELVVVDRTVKIRRAIAWAAEPLADGAEDVAADRLAEVIQLESARPYRDTILGNRNRDPEAVGWKRISHAGACKFCVMLAGRGTVYRSKTVRFAAHENCFCSAAPVFGKDDVGEEVTGFQYMASLRQRTPEQKAELRAYLNANFSDSPG